MKRNPPDIILLFSAIALLMLGLIAVFSAGAPESLRITKGESVFHFGIRQFIFLVVGFLFLMYPAIKICYTNWKKLSLFFLLSSLALLIAVLFIGSDIKGSHRWIDFGFINFQPSEYAKLAVIFILAHYLSEIKGWVRSLTFGIVLPMIVLMIVCFLIMLEPDLGTTIVIFGVSLIMIFVAGARMLHLSSLTLMGVGAVAALIWMEPYRFKRLVAFLDPWKDPKGDGWQIIQSLYALGSGGIFGLGIGMSRQKFNYLPEPHTDYIFAILGEEIGLIGTAAVIILFFIVAWRGFKIAMNARDFYGKLLATGITAYFSLQALVNIGVVTSSIPVTGITLPFLSYGGSSLFVSMFALGVLLNISKYSEETELSD